MVVSSMGVRSSRVRSSRAKRELHAAAEAGDLETIWRVIGENAHIDGKDKWGYTALLKAAEKGYIDCLALLLNAGANKNRHSKWCENTPLILAAENGHGECVRLLLMAGSDPLQTDTFGNTALHKCAAYNHLDCAQHLLAAGADVNQQNKYGVTALHMSARNGFNQITSELLAQPECDVDVQDQYGATPLFYACNSGRYAAVEMLLAKHPDTQLVNTRTGRGPFAEALVRKHIAVCVLFMSHTLKVHLNLYIPHNYWAALTLLTEQALHKANVDKFHYMIIQILASLHSMDLRPGGRVQIEILNIMSLIIKGTDISKLNSFYGKYLFLKLILKHRMDELLLMLCEAGQRWNNEDLQVIAKHSRSLRNQVAQYQENPLSLQRICRQFIRASCGFNIFIKVPHLGLPKQMQNYVVLQY